MLCADVGRSVKAESDDCMAVYGPTVPVRLA